jgi:hypothetical protein
MNTSPLIRFYLGQGTDHAGRMISEIHSFYFHQLESYHDYIQWLFPLPNRSVFNPDAPILTEEDRLEFHHHPLVRQNYHISWTRMLDFFGYFVNQDGLISKTCLWGQLAPRWLSPENHNGMKVTRMLRSSMLCGFGDQARAFYETVIIDSRSGGGDWKRPLDYWKDAVSLNPMPPCSI